jgi:hypothetical protein
MRFTPVAIFGEQVEFPVSGALYRLEPTIFGDKNPIGNGAEISTLGTTQFLTDSTASVFTNNVIKSQGVEIDNLPTSQNLGTIAWAWRCRPSGSNRLPLVDRFLLDTRSGPVGPDQGIVNGFIEINTQTSPRLEVGAHYQSASYYNAFGNQDLQKFEINSNNLETQYPDTTFNTGSMSFPGYYANNITGSGSLIFADTGSNAYRFNAFSPNTVGIPTGSGVYQIQIFDSDSGGGKWYWNNGIDEDRNVFNIAAITVFNRVLNDDEVREVFNYYTSSLGLEIGL